MEQTVILITELVGTVAFAFSGAMVGIEKRMDVFGVWLLAITTAVGGGMLRDLLLGNVPPVMFRNPLYVAVATATALPGVFGGLSWTGSLSKPGDDTCFVLEGHQRL